MLLSGIRINKTTFMPKVGFDILKVLKRKKIKGIEHFYLAPIGEDQGVWVSEQDLIKNYTRF